MWLSVGKVAKCLSHAVQLCDVLQDVFSVPANGALGQRASSGSSLPEGRSSTSTENLPYLSELLICVLIWSFSNYWLAVLLTSNYFFAKLESAKFAMTGMNLIIPRAVGKCVFADKAPHTTHLTRYDPHMMNLAPYQRRIWEKEAKLL